MVFHRSLVLAREQRIGVQVLERSGRVAVSLDGALRGVLGPGDWISVYAGPRRARLVRLTDTNRSRPGPRTVRARRCRRGARRRSASGGVSPR